MGSATCPLVKPAVPAFDTIDTSKIWPPVQGGQYLDETMYTTIVTTNQKITIVAFRAQLGQESHTLFCKAPPEVHASITATTSAFYENKNIVLISLSTKLLPPLQQIVISYVIDNNLFQECAKLASEASVSLFRMNQFSKFQLPPHKFLKYIEDGKRGWAEPWTISLEELNKELAPKEQKLPKESHHLIRRI